ncbi:unnamed protein product [Cuscuta europaea]|uniref:Uncharacterized protein n=1 Tax=Cuscuta europaea TaxID=41803 RepID=A0A9P1EJK6_CUSEU|nr:unnamed protein product [Cuscuta europaea]
MLLLSPSRGKKRVNIERAIVVLTAGQSEEKIAGEKARITFAALPPRAVFAGVPFGISNWVESFHSRKRRVIVDRSTSAALRPTVSHVGGEEAEVASIGLDCCH